MNISDELLLDFFRRFSLLEYALKKGGLGRQMGGDGVGIDWDGFTEDPKIPSNILEATDFVQAKQYLLNNPPKRQRWDSNKKKLEWESVGANGDSFKDVLKQVRTVRNNLFHGGKYPGNVIDDAERNQTLLQACIVVLKACSHSNRLESYMKLD